MVSDAKTRAYKSFSERLQTAAKEKKIPAWGLQSEIARMVSVSPRAARKWLEGDSMPDVAHGSILANKLGVSFNWLMANQGAMELPDAIDPEGLAIALCWAGLSDDIKHVIRNMLNHSIDPSNPGFERWKNSVKQAPGMLQDQRGRYSKEN